MKIVMAVGATHVLGHVMVAAGGGSRDVILSQRLLIVALVLDSVVLT